MNPCGAVTRSGEPCKRRVKHGNRCHLHTESEHPENTCSVCLCELTGPCKKLPCTHEFHRRCILEWKNRGNNTCPYCRAVFAEPPPEYRVTILVENTNNARTSRRFTLDEIPEILMDLVDPDALTTEVRFDVTSDEALHAILDDFGLQTLRDLL